ncbi:MAG: hypothetical protein NTZ48_06185, partial [Candidatus Omnitrophica bacterium]|nr:hypothetical protein [Candidatus Omnitrophota bacterium]
MSKKSAIIMSCFLIVIFAFQLFRQGDSSLSFQSCRRVVDRGSSALYPLREGDWEWSESTSGIFQIKSEGGKVTFSTRAQISARFMEPARKLSVYLEASSYGVAIITGFDADNHGTVQYGRTLLPPGSLKGFIYQQGEIKNAGGFSQREDV